MKMYKIIDISEKQLEEMIRIGPNLIEDGLRYVDHQKRTERGPLDVLFADSGNALVVAELKVVEDDGMLVQGIDYYDYITSNVEGFARAYKGASIDPSQTSRLFLIAPSFSVSILNRCKWIDIPISLFTFQCISFEKNPQEPIPVFKEINIPSRLEPVEVYTIEQRLDYITNSQVRKQVQDLLDVIQSWDEKNILIEPTKNVLSIKLSGRVITHVGPRRKHFIIYTNDEDGKWTGFPIHQDEDLDDVRIILKSNYEKAK